MTEPTRLTLLRALLQRDPEVADDRKAGVVVKYATADDAKVRIGHFAILEPLHLVERQRQRTA